MENLSISLPETLKDFVVAQASEGGYGSVSDYVSALVRADQRQKAKAMIEAEVLKELESGPSVPMTEEDWASLRARAAGRVTRQ
jgi:putative addiction module CopG family antidote